KGNLDAIQEQIDQNEPDSWKGYNISNSAKVDNDPDSLMRQWRHDDADVAYPTFELIQKNYEKLKGRKPGFNNISVHKDLAPARQIRSVAIRRTCPKRRATGRSSTSLLTTPASNRTSSWPTPWRRSKRASSAVACRTLVGRRSTPNS